MLNYEVTRWNPFLLNGQRDFAAMFDRHLGRREWSGGRMPPMDAFARDNHYVIRVDMPGVDPKDLDIQVEGRILSIKGERKGEEKGHYLRETFRGRFQRAVRLPEGLATDRLEARYRNGVIEISVPLPTQAAGRKVPVRIEAGEPTGAESKAG